MSGELYTIRAGSGGRKIVFVHGNMASSRWWLSVMEEMQDNYELLALDMRGFGRSPEGRPDVRLSDHARDILATVTSLGFYPFVLVGHSLGGAVAMQFAADYPDMLDALVLVDSAPVDGMKNIDYGRVELMLNDKNILAAALRAIMARPVNEEYMAGLLEDCWRAIPAVLPNTRALDGADFTGVARRFEKPVLVIHGEKDFVVSVEDAHRTAAAFPRASMVVMAGIGHCPQVEDTAGFIRYLDDFCRKI